jgi:hypothetical protein
MTTDESKLWKLISLFEFEKQPIKLTFAKRLARENDISELFAKQIIEEYKKFIFLCCVSKDQVTPSHYVDLAWHLHLTYTKSYWVDLCQNTLQREIHHSPTEGGMKENQKFESYYSKTLKLYEVYFGAKAPLGIWQDSEERFKVRITNVDKRKNWIIPKPDFSKIRGKFYLLVVVSFASIIFVGCDGNSFTDISVIGIFLGIIITVFVLALRRNEQKRKKQEGDNSGCGSTVDNTPPHSGGHTHSHGHDDSDSGGSDDGGGDGGCSGCGGGD